MVFPIRLPPIAAVYQLIVFPVETALKSALSPQISVAGVAVTDAGAAGGVTVVTTAVLVELVQVLLVASA
jgi:hypothetical protein